MTETLMQVLGGALLISLCAQIKIPLPFSPVPLSLQTFAVMVISLMLSKERSLLSVLAYCSFAALGAPVLAGGVSDPLALVGPTGGYIVGFAVQAYLAGTMLERFAPRSFLGQWSIVVLASFVQLLMGVTWLAQFVGWQQVLWMGFYPFLPGDVIKTLSAVMLFRKHAMHG